MNRNRNIFKLLLFILLVCFTAGCQQGTSGDQPSPVTQTTDSIKQQTDLSQSQQVNELKSQNDMLLQRSRFTTGGVAMILGIVALLAFLAFNSRWTRRIEIKNRQLQRERNVVIAQNKQLAIERDRAEAASKAKTAFIRSMTHEIRTPLNAISGFSQVLILDGDALEADERLDMFIRISDGIRRLTNILDDLILISDYESRTDVLPADDCVISTVISQAIHNVKPMVPKGVMLENQSELSPELTVKTNSRAVQHCREVYYRRTYQAHRYPLRQQAAIIRQRYRSWHPRRQARVYLRTFCQDRQFLTGSRSRTYRSSSAGRAYWRHPNSRHRV